MGFQGSCWWDFAVQVTFINAEFLPHMPCIFEATNLFTSIAPWFSSI